MAALRATNETLITDLSSLPCCYLSEWLCSSSLALSTLTVCFLKSSLGSVTPCLVVSSFTDFKVASPLTFINVNFYHRP